MPYEFYTALHIFGIGLLITSLGGLSVHALLTDKSQILRRHLLFLHGAGLALILLGGFGMLAKLGISWPLPIWILSKIFIWIIFSGSIAMLYRSDKLNRLFWVLVPIFLLLAWYMATFKP